MARRLRTLGLVPRFALLSLLCTATLGVGLAVHFDGEAKARAARQAIETTALVGELAQRLHIIGSSQQRFDDVRFHELQDAIAAETPVVGLALWNARGGTFYASDTRTVDDELPGQGQLADALRLRRTGYRRVGDTLRVYAPLGSVPDKGAPAVLQVDYSYRPIAAELAREQRRIYLLLGAALLVLWATLFQLVTGASRRLREGASQLEHMALHDALTGLPNRLLFADRVGQAITAARRRGGQLAVLLMDLNRFKEVNDTLGHRSGDVLLHEVAVRIRDVLRESDTVARLGGDEFAVLVPSTLEPADADEVAERLRAALEEPFVLEGLPISLDASVGIAVYPLHGEDVETLLQRADVAMYGSKAAHTAYEHYDPTADDYSPERLALVADLRRAIEERELVVHYQPKGDLATGKVTSVEALVRWQHPERGLLFPGDFLPLAQQTSLIRPLTSFVLAEAVRQCKRWQREGHDLSVAVNLSPRSLLDTSLPDEIAATLAEHGLAPASLQLELTESSVMVDPVRAADVLTRLHVLGVFLSIDDFGTGYSSLSYLKELPVDEVKIDRSFVCGIEESEDSAVIVRSTIDLGRNLGLSVVAEGVESATVCDQLRVLGCHLAQGYFLSPPVPEDELLARLPEAERQLAAALGAAATSVA